MTTIKTGMVYQRTLKGPNYVCLGKARVDGKTMIISVKNGNITASGKSKRMTKEAVAIHAHDPELIARVHQVRTVDVASVFNLGQAESSVRPALKKLLTKGVVTNAELPSLAQLR
jgi:hypothetical protein